MRKLFMLFVLTLVVASCRKKSEAHFSIDNDNDMDLTIVIYGSQADYVNGTNAVVSGVAAGKGSFIFPASKLKLGSWYWTDVYSANYAYTNWVSGDDFIIGRDSSTPRRFKYTASKSSESVGMLFATNARVSLLDNSKPKTQWYAVNALDLTDGSDIWYSLSDDERVAAITVNKDETGTYSYKDGGALMTQAFTFGTIVGYPVYTILPNETYLTFFISNTTANPALFGYEPTTIDSVESLINGHLYILAKR